MEVVLLERIERLGQMGDVVRVKDGYARNFLLPQKKALRATKVNMEQFETQKVQLEAHNLERKTEAEAVSGKIEGSVFVALRQAGDSGQLYGSVSTRDVAQLVTEGGATVTRNQIILDRPIKTVGLHDVRVALHPEVEVSLTINVARSDDEAERQARGETIGIDDEYLDDQEEAISAEEVFEDESLAEQAEEELAEGESDDANETEEGGSRDESGTGDESSDEES